MKQLKLYLICFICCFRFLLQIYKSFLINKRKRNEKDKKIEMSILLTSIYTQGIDAPKTS